MIAGLTAYTCPKSGSAPTGEEGQELDVDRAGASWVGRLETCQRRLVVVDRASAQRPVAMPQGATVYQGSEAYDFLLQVATGLASRLTGETNILGQMKSAWVDSSRHVAWLQWLFADAKEIRANFLSSVGGDSYGRLTRHLLRAAGGPQGGPILLVGAGDMARTVAPWLQEWPLQILNRTVRNAEKLEESLREHRALAAEVVPVSDAESAWRSAGAVIVCVPLDASEDEHRLAWMHAEALAGRNVPVIHLGCHRPDAGAWNFLPQFRCLDDLYEAQHQADDRRHRQFQLARQACTLRARHRALGASLSHPHGWEDLPDFFPLPTEAQVEYQAGPVPGDFVPAELAA